MVFPWREPPTYSDRSRPPAQATRTRAGTSERTVMARAKSSLLSGAVLLALSSLQAQVLPPSATDLSPTANTEVSSLIHTGCGYDAWTGSVHRSVTDLEVPGAVSFPRLEMGAQL